MATLGIGKGKSIITICPSVPLSLLDVLCTLRTGYGWKEGAKKDLAAEGGSTFSFYPLFLFAHPRKPFHRLVL